MFYSIQTRLFTIERIYHLGQWGLAVVGETVLRKDERRFIANNQSEGYWRTLLEEISGVGGVLAKSTLIGFLLKAGQSGQ